MKISQKNKAPINLANHKQKNQRRNGIIEAYEIFEIYKILSCY